MVPLCIWTSGVVSNAGPTNVMVACVYIYPTSSILSIGYSRYNIIVSSLVWSIDPKAFLKSRHSLYISCW